MSADWEHGGFGIYVHWPFCEAKCPYCDFNSHVVRFIDQKRWCAAYLKEIDRIAPDLKGRVVRSVFFGGGTPSLMAPETVAAILERIRFHWPMANDPEITLEANPSSVEAGLFRAFADAGITRVSMGIQALNDPDLKRLGRLHSLREAEQAFDIARDTFDRVSFDLIYARQYQTLDQWKEELRRALAMAVDHVSLYQLTIEEGTAFGDRYAIGRLKGIPVDDVAADMYEATQEICAAFGFEAYEVSNHAKPGAVSQHNLIYWRYGDYAGIGPGAHGRVTLGGQRYATEARPAPGAWLADVEGNADDFLRQALSPLEQAHEFLLMGLRLSEGIDLRRYKVLAGRALDQDRVSELEDLGFVEMTGPTLRTTAQGRLLLNAVIERLMP